VLRNISRRRGTIALPARPEDVSDRQAALAYLSVTLSHPLWLAVRWFDRLGFERTEAWMQFNSQPAPVTLRVNPLRTSREELLEHLARRDVSVRAGRWAPDALVVVEGDALADRTDDGGFVVQDEASQLVALLAGAHPGPRVLDACASPGGKTTAFAAASPGSFIVACDVRARRMSLLATTVASAGATNVRLVQADLLQHLPFPPVFDVVVVDAPCSGLGTLRRDPDIRWRRTEDELPRFAEAQCRMLKHAAAAVKPGGRLVYATCSSEPEENEDVARAFLACTGTFHAVDAQSVHGALSPLVDGRGYLRTEPDRHDLEMFFGAVFHRTDE